MKEIFLTGRIDSGNAKEVEATIDEELRGRKGESLTIDVADLEYISSAGLRVILRLRKAHPDLRIVNANSEIYEILDMTGFTQMMPVEKAYRKVSVEGCEVIGEGANGKVYRIDDDNVVKTYKNADALAEIRHEREVAKTALVLGIPTAISYDVVKVEDHYGSVFELLDAKSFSKILATEPDRFDWCVKEYAGLLRRIHETKVPPGKLPSIKENMKARVVRIREEFPAEVHDRLARLIEEVPESDHMIHGDYHTKNVVLSGDEVLLIDMDTLAVGHPIFELAQMYNAFCGFSEYNHDIIREFQGFDHEIAVRFWNAVLKEYLETEDEEYCREVEDKARIPGYVLLIDWYRRHRDLGDPEVQATMALWKERLIERVMRVESLDFACHTDTREDQGEVLTIGASRDNLPAVMSFVEAHFEAMDCDPKIKMQMSVAVEEIFTNIASYAYPGDKGEVTIRLHREMDPKSVQLTFIDQGIAYDPVAKEDPDVTLPAEERGIGGLGIFMVKQIMDQVEYQREGEENILSLYKRL